MVKWILLGAAVAMVLPFATYYGVPYFASPDENVGNVYIVGNEHTDDAAIREVVQIYPGMAMPSRATILQREFQLSNNFGDRMIPGKRPRIHVVREEDSAESRYKSIVIDFPER